MQRCSWSSSAKQKPVAHLMQIEEDDLEAQIPIKESVQKQIQAGTEKIMAWSLSPKH